MKTSSIAAARLAAILVLAAHGESVAQQPAAAVDAPTVIRRLVDRTTVPASFRTRVHVRVRMLNFPWISLRLDGTSYFKRPDAYEVVFDRVPSYAAGMKHLFADIADPAQWQRDWIVDCNATTDSSGSPVLKLRMTKRGGGNVREQDAFVNPAAYTIVRMEWHYANGGTIAMTQSYRTEGAYTLIASQHADIQLPHVHAAADASYEPYQTNIALDERVFAQR